MTAPETTEAKLRVMLAGPQMLAALRIAVRQNSHDMLMTGEELRACEAAIAAATGPAVVWTTACVGNDWAGERGEVKR